MQQILLEKGKKVYFASDFHLGIPTFAESKQREKKISAWFDSIKNDAQIIILAGDLFDFWFEYKNAVPKGFLIFFSKIIELQNNGVEFIFFTGNHDLWMFDYFETELEIKVFRQPERFEINQKSFLVGHGDGIGPGDFGYKKLKKLFTNKTAQFLFGWLHPNIGLWFGNKWSMSRKMNITEKTAPPFLGNENEWIFQFAIEMEKSQHHDFYIFGHRHLALDMEVNKESRYINLGEWFISGKNTFALFDGEQTELKEFI